MRVLPIFAGILAVVAVLHVLCVIELFSAMSFTTCGTPLAMAEYRLSLINSPFAICLALLTAVTHAKRKNIGPRSTVFYSIVICAGMISFATQYLIIAGLRIAER